jgi:glutamate-1-semialdehyde 2,1-aminomutase
MIKPPAAGFAGSLRHRERASRTLARGVSSSPRVTQRPVPLAIASAKGAHITDVDGNTYIDYSMGYGPLILGHTPQVVADAVQREIANGLRTGTVHRAEAELADRIAAIVPSATVSTFLSSGTEACQQAVRIARAATGRLRIVKFRYHYHGWSDGLHLASQPGRDGPTTAGQDPDAIANVIVLDWGDADALARSMSSEIAAVIMEPAAINAGCFAPPEGFLERARALTKASGAILIFDEVITGFRLALGGAQQRYGVVPDMSVLGKALGAGLPISAITGSAAAMGPLVSGEVMHRGTYNGNPLSTAAAVACVDYLAANATELYPRIDRYAATIAESALASARRKGVAIAANCVGPCVQLFAGAESVPALPDIVRTNAADTLALTEAIVMQGIAPLPRGLMYVSAAHTEDDIEATTLGIDAAIEALARKR